MNKSRPFLAFIAAAASGGLLIAADPPPASGPGFNGAGRPEGRGFGRGDFQGPGGGIPALSEQQRQLFEKSLDGDKLRRLQEQMRAAQKELLSATLAAEYDEKVVRSKAEAMAKIQVEMTLLRTKALSAVSSTMQPEQRQQLVESPGGSMLLHGAGGPRGGMPGGLRPGGPGSGGGGFSAGRDPGPRER